MPSQCPELSLKSFPVNIQGFTPDKTFYDTIKEPLTLKFTWKYTNEVPHFSTSANVNSGQISHSSIDNTTLLYENRNYSLVSLQLTVPTHNKWLALTATDATTVNNLEDVILTFTCESIPGDTAKPPQYIILVNPIIRTTNPRVSSSFLTSLATQQNLNGNIGVDSLFPNNNSNQYAYYTTCAQGITSGSDYQNVLVVVNVQGLLVWADYMDNIKSIYTAQKTNSYPLYDPIYYGLFSSTIYTFRDRIDMSNRVKVSYGYGSSSYVPSIPVEQETVTDAYKCVPLNPETQINGSALKVDSSTGTLLSNVLAERQTTVNEYNTKGIANIPFTTLEKVWWIFLIVITSVIFIYIIGYTILAATIGPKATGPEAHGLWHRMLQNIIKTPIYVVVAFFSIFIGMMIGVAVKLQG
jgi:hypothetical protein